MHPGRGAGTASISRTPAGVLRVFVDDPGVLPPAKVREPTGFIRGASGIHFTINGVATARVPFPKTMKGKQLLLLLLLVGGLGYAGWLSFQGSRESWSQKGAGGAGTKVVTFPINDVTQVQIKDSSTEVNLIKGDDWMVKERADYPANFEQVSELLRKLWDLKTVQEVKAGPSQYPRLQLVQPGQGDSAGTLIDLKDKDGKSIAAVILGKKHMNNSGGGDDPGFATGRYLMPLGDKARVSLVSETFDAYEPKPERWLRKDFIKVENPKTITLNGADEKMRWSVTRESATGEWKLADAKGDEKLDTSKVSMFGSAFSSPSFKDVVAPGTKPEETGLDKPSTLKIETFDGFTYTMEIGKVKDEAYPVKLAVAATLKKERTPGKDEKPEDKTKLDDEFKASLKKLEDKLAAEKKFESRTYLVEKFTLDSLLKERTALLPEKKAEPAPAAAAPPTTPSAATPPAAPAKPSGPVTVTTPPVSIPAAASAPVAVPPAPPAPAPESPKPATPPAPPAPAADAPPKPAAPETPAKPATPPPTPAPEPPKPNP